MVGSLFCLVLALTEALVLELTGTTVPCNQVQWARENNVQMDILTQVIRPLLHAYNAADRTPRPSVQIRTSFGVFIVCDSV
eukprot:2098989-Rhodomonas_salina.1